MPAFLVGGLAAFVHRDVGISVAQFGLSISAFFVVSAALSILGGVVAQSVSSSRGLAGCAVLSGVALIGLALFAHNWWTFILFLAIGGSGNALAQPVANRILLEVVPFHRRGVAFGVKQSAVPLSGVLAGIAVPVVEQVGGWRWAVGGAAAIAVLLTLAGSAKLPSTRPAERPPRGRLVSRRPLLLIVVIGLLGTVGTSTAGSFLVISIVHSGSGVALGGALLIAGNAAAIGVRISLGWYLDKAELSAHSLQLVAGLCVVACVGYALLAVVSGAVMLCVGALLALIGGSGWQGMYHFSVVTRNPTAPATATGVAQSGMYAGGVIGPALFGALADHAGFGWAWSSMAVAAAAAAALALIIESRTHWARRSHGRVLRQLRSTRARPADVEASGGYPSATGDLRRATAGEPEDRSRPDRG
jgi:predicted MFS family arabinose efflux permease